MADRGQGLRQVHQVPIDIEERGSGPRVGSETIHETVLFPMRMTKPVVLGQVLNRDCHDLIELRRFRVRFKHDGSGAGG